MMYKVDQKLSCRDDELDFGLDSFRASCSSFSKREGEEWVDHGMMVNIIYSRKGWAHNVREREKKKSE